MAQSQSKDYPAIFFKQRPESPLQVAFAAPSSEIDAWARVPTKKTANIRNFQRAEIRKHIQEVEIFFKDKANSSPTAVVVGFDPIRSKERVLLSADGKPVDPTSILAGVPTVGTLRITWPIDDDPQTQASLVEAILKYASPLAEYIYQELFEITSVTKKVLDDIAAALPHASTASEPPDAVAEEADSEGDILVDDADDDEPVPQEILELLPGLSPSERHVVVGRLRFLAQLSKDRMQELSESELAELYKEVRDEMKPGLLIDGQHRVMGTRKLQNIPFLVTALPTADWSELAFQFIVTNRTARRVPESLLISIVGNSLSKKQRNEIEGRLREANIRVGLIEAVMTVHEDEQSPFYGLLAFGLKNETGFLDAAAMRGKVIQLWFERRGPVQTLFDHFCEGKRKIDRTEFWKSEEKWFEFFIAFWDAVKSRYAGSQTFSSERVPDSKGKLVPASRLMSATVLMIFQETVLDHIEGLYKQLATAQSVPISTSIPNSDKFTDIVEGALKPLTPEFFQGWQLSGFDGSIGARQDLANAISAVLRTDKTVAQLKGGAKPHRLYRSESKV